MSNIWKTFFILKGSNDKIGQRFMGLGLTLRMDAIIYYGNTLMEEQIYDWHMKKYFLPMTIILYFY